MPKIEDTLTIMGFAWIDSETGEINWAMKEDLQDVPPEERPEGCTPVVIEITPTLEWVDKKHREHEFLGDLQEKMSKFTTDLNALKHDMRLKNG